MSDFLTRMRRRMAMTHGASGPSPSTAPSYEGDLVARGSVLPLGVYEDGNGVRQFGAAWPGVLVDAARAFTAPGRAMQGEMPVETMTDEALNFAGTVGGGGMAAGTAPGGALGMFAGRRAKTADLSALARAEDLAAKGTDRRTIWDETGWFQGADGKWRWEIDDSGSEMVDPFGYDASGLLQRREHQFGERAVLGEVMQHDALADAYERAPSLLVGGDAGGAYGSYSPERGLDLGKGADTPELARSTLLHELQHVVQSKEGFARGGNTEHSADDLVESINRAMGDKSREMDRLRKAAAGKWGAEREAIDAQIARLNDEYMALMTERSQGLSPEARHNRYKRTAGEVEARNVQSRRDMTPEERRARPPWETQDVSDAEQIVRFGDGDRIDEYLRRNKARRALQGNF